MVSGPWSLVPGPFRMDGGYPSPVSDPAQSSVLGPAGRGVGKHLLPQPVTGATPPPPSQDSPPPLSQDRVVPLPQRTRIVVRQGWYSSCVQAGGLSSL